MEALLLLHDYRCCMFTVADGVHTGEDEEFISLGTHLC